MGPISLDRLYCSVAHSGGSSARCLPPISGDTDVQTEAALQVLADKMTSVADPADPKDGPDDEESGFPAAYTYFGQFIDHDLTFDPASSLQKQNDPGCAGGLSDATVRFG